METLLLKKIRDTVSEWRSSGYPGILKETLNIIAYTRRVAFLHEPQIEALETYMYLKEVVGNKTSVDLFRSFFTDDKELLLGLGVSKDKAFDLIGNDAEIDVLLQEAFGTSDYPNQVYALTMGSGKTVLMAVMMAYDFVLSFYHQKDERFAKNALVFAPDTTIIESLKEIKTFDYTRVLPREYQNVLLNIKYHHFHR
jgi:type III restriction enzyme